MFERKWLAKGTTQCRDGITKTIITNSIYCFDFRFFGKNIRKTEANAAEKNICLYMEGVSK